MTGAPLLLGVDVGTTGAKALLATPAGDIVAEHTAHYDILTPRMLWAEQWPSVWLDGLTEAIRGVVERAGDAAGRVAALTISSLYGGSGIPVDEELEALHTCLIWMDRRAREEAQWVRDEIGVDRLVEITGNGVDSYYGFTKILWLRDHEPDVWNRTRYLLPPNAFLIQRLTGEIAVDHSSAGNIGGVYDLNRRRWSDEACELLGIDIDRFPARLVASHDVVGELHRAGAELTGLAAGTPVCAGGIDAAAATLSAGVTAPGRHVAMMGTSMCWGFVHGSPPTEPGLVSMPYVLHPHELTYTFGGAATAGAVPTWLRDQLAGVRSDGRGGATDVDGADALAELDARAEQVPAGSDGLLFLPYLMGERSPIWDPDARGTITGLTLSHTGDHLYRAGLEGVAFALRHNIEYGRRAGYPLDDVLHVVGGATRSPTWLQIMADVTGLPIVATRGGEAAYAGAMLGAIGVGLVDVDDLDTWYAAPGRSDPFEPDPAATVVYDDLYPHYVGLYEDLRDRFAALQTR